VSKSILLHIVLVRIFAGRTLFKYQFLKDVVISYLTLQANARWSILEV